jgi:1-acyl-sn-glycerol-3-phosphate acyltransferase
MTTACDGVQGEAKRVPRPSDCASPVVYRLIRWTFARLMHLFYRYQVSGRENIPAEGRVILAVNHLHLCDPGAVMPAISRMVVTLAAEKWENNLVFGSILRAAGVIFVQRGEVDRQALRSCLRVLNEGRMLAVAPEGTRSKTGAMQRAKPGIAYLAMRTDAPILPVAIIGTEKFGQWEKLRRPTCWVIIGRPFRLPQGDSKPSTEQLQELADLIMIRLGLYLPPAYRGVYAAEIASIEAGQSDRLSILLPA